MGAKGEAGEVTGQVKGWLGDIMYGRIQHPWGVIIPEKQ
jgi:branched-chain amino acid aminotransferase